MAVEVRSSGGFEARASVSSRIPHPDQLPSAKIPLNLLLKGDSPRGAGEDPEHARTLAESESELPPIIVHRPTMRVIDGMHRLRAARMRGQRDIAVRFYDGDEADAFVLAVRANVAHGLPLSLADRKSAAARIIESHPKWSDRVIAMAVGLSAKTIAGIRGRPTRESAQLDVRVGRDGRVRPVNGAEGRRIASRLMTQDPEASLREIAAKAGISPETVRDVRARLSRGEDPVPSRRPGIGDHSGQPRQEMSRHKQAQSEVLDQVRVMQVLKADPALRLTEAGRALLRLLDAQRIIQEQRDWLLQNLPSHCVSMVADGARACAEAWCDFAQVLEQGRNGHQR